MLYSLKRYEESEVSRERLRIIRFYGKHGEEATKEAFGADWELIHVWRKKLKGAEGLMGLVPQSTRPLKTRSMQTDPRIVTFIRQMRQQHPRMGKEKLKPFLDQ